jgi:hypothetical protein
MASRRVSEPSKRRPPATTPEARENQVIAAAYDLAERQILAGDASSQVITHFLKLGSSREKLEKERISLESQFLQAKADAMASQKRTEELMSEALDAFRSYSGTPTDGGLDD